MPGLLNLNGPVGSGQPNDPDDVYAFDNALRRIGAYAPPLEYSDEPQRYPTAPMIDALERFQDREGLKVDRYADPGGPTERAINNRLLAKPRGAGLLREPIDSLVDAVGNGFANPRKDVQAVQRALGALGYLAEDPFDDPHGIIDEPTTKGIRRFQENHGLTVDGWLAPNGETEQALRAELGELARRSTDAWREYWEREAKDRPNELLESDDNNAIVPAYALARTVPRPITTSPTSRRYPATQSAPPGPRPGTPDRSKYPRRQYLTNPGELRPFDPARPEPKVPPNSDPIEPLYGYTDEVDIRQWLDQQSRMHARDREANVPIPGNERDPMRPGRSGFQGVPDGIEFKERAFDGSIRAAADRVTANSRGNERTQNFNYSIVDWLNKLAEEHDCKVTHKGGSRDSEGKAVKETWLGPARPRTRPDGTEDKRTGGARPDITFEAPGGRPRLYINTADLKGLDPTNREYNSGLRILANSNSGDLLLIVPKVKDGEALDFEALRTVVSTLLDRLCSDSGTTTNRMTIFRGILRASP